MSLSATELRESDAKSDSEIAQNEILKRHRSEDGDDLEQKDRTGRKPANIRSDSVQSSVECDCDDDDDLEQKDRTGRKPASVGNKKMRKPPSETVQSSAQSDSEQENLEQNRAGRKPVSIRRKRKLRKPQSNTVQSSVESESEADDDWELEDITERKQASIWKKKMEKSLSPTVKSSGESQHNPLVINLVCFYMGQTFNENITVKRCPGTQELLVQMTKSSNACFVSKKTQAANNGTG